MGAQTMRSLLTRVRVAIVAAGAVGLCIIQPAHASPGQLDTSFGSGGVTWAAMSAPRFDTGSCGEDWCTGPVMAVAPDGRIVVAGQDDNQPLPRVLPRVRVARYLPNGALDRG